MKAEILSVGTELLLGEITDTNATFLAQQLAELGIDLSWVTQCGDNLQRLTWAIGQALERSDLIITTGGIGPTEDDPTREAIAASLGEEMQVVPELERTLRHFFSSRGRPMPERNLKQATLIPSAEALPNPIGTAPGWLVHKGGKVLVAMPGVPHEMRRMWSEEAVPRLRELGLTTATIHSVTLRTSGIGESDVEERLGLLVRGPNPTVATYAKRDAVEVRITAKAATARAALELLNPVVTEVQNRLQGHVYGTGQTPLAAVVGETLAQRGLTLAVAESCTGGALASEISDVPGSSSYFLGGIVAYAVPEKVRLGVDQALIERCGTVSREVALALAEAAKQHFGSSFALSVTGVAGPAEVEGKPVGTVFIGLSGPKGAGVHHRAFGALGRSQVKLRAVMAALYLLWRELQ